MSNYVNNEEFLKALVERRESIKDIEKEEDYPQISNYIGLCILQICTRFSLKGNFVNYSYRSEMVSDAIENCISVVDNFDPEKSSNPFAYFTQIAYFAFLRRIDAEKKQSYFKAKLIERMSIDHLMELNEEESQGDFIENFSQHYYFDTQDYEKKRSDKKEKSKKVKETRSILDFEE